MGQTWLCTNHNQWARLICLVYPVGLLQTKEQWEIRFVASLQGNFGKIDWHEFPQLI